MTVTSKFSTPLSLRLRSPCSFVILDCFFRYKESSSEDDEVQDSKDNVYQEDNYNEDNYNEDNYEDARDCEYDDEDQAQDQDDDEDEDVDGCSP